jgi:hypothetical protein
MGGFLDGRVPKNDIMKKEDEAMWIDDGSSSGGGWNPFKIAASLDKPKKPESKASPKAKKASPPVEPKKKSGGLKMPWDK